MQKALYLTLLLILNLTFLHAQTSEEANVAAVINRLFTGMNKADSAILNSTFAKDATLASVGRNKEGITILRKESVLDFASIVSKQTAGHLTEEIWNLKIQIDGSFAQAWCDYALFVENQFNHCGVDAFHLYKSKDGWKIFHLADTRRKEGCTVPEDIQKKHK